MANFEVVNACWVFQFGLPLIRWLVYYLFEMNLNLQIVEK